MTAIRVLLAINLQICKQVGDNLHFARAIVPAPAPFLRLKACEDARDDDHGLDKDGEPIPLSEGGCDAAEDHGLTRFMLTVPSSNEQSSVYSHGGCDMVDPSRAGTVRNLVEIVAFVSVVVADAMGLVPITQTIFLVPLIWILLRSRNERWSSIGFRRPESLKRAVVLGILAGVVLETFAVLVTTPGINAFLGVEPDYSELKAVQGNLKLLIVFLGFSWVIAAFGEEICFRGFLMKRLAQVFGEGQTAWIASLLVSSALFGWGHTEQGIAGWIQEGLSGLWLGILFLATRRNLAVPFVAHGVSNTLAFVLIYLGRYPGLG